MSTAAITSALTRSAAQSLVERAERQSGSRMAAYEMVAQTVGTSAEWLRKFINGSEAKEPKWTVGWNLLDHYNRICNRVEQEADNERTKRLALREKIDAINATVNQVVARTAGAEGSGAGIGTTIERPR